MPQVLKPTAEFSDPWGRKRLPPRQVGTKVKVVYLVGQETRMGCGPGGLGFDTCDLSCLIASSLPLLNSHISTFYLCSGEFQCSYGKMCIPQAQVCDGRPQCRDQSDEINCIRPSKSCEFRCADGSRCIPKKFVCDEERDCPDGTDEVGCGRNVSGRVIELRAVLLLSITTLVSNCSSCSCWHNGVDLHQSVFPLSQYIPVHLPTAVV